MTLFVVGYTVKANNYLSVSLTLFLKIKLCVHLFTQAVMQRYIWMGWMKKCSSKAKGYSSV